MNRFHFAKRVGLGGCRSGALAYGDEFAGQILVRRNAGLIKLLIHLFDKAT